MNLTVYGQMVVARWQLKRKTMLWLQHRIRTHCQMFVNILSILLHSRCQLSILRCILQVCCLITGVYLIYIYPVSPGGSPLPLGDILSSPLLRASALPKTERTTFSLQQRGQLFPLLSQGEHPTLGTPCWFFHPCETPTALAELKQAGEQDDSFPGRTIMLWLLLLGNVVDLRM